MHILLDDVDKAELEDRIQQNENSIGQLSEEIAADTTALKSDFKSVQLEELGIQLGLG